MRFIYRILCLAVVLAGLCHTQLNAAPGHPHPYLMPPAEKQRLLQRIKTNEIAREQYEQIKARANQGKFGDAALVFALEGGEKHAATVRSHLLQLVRYRTPRLDDDIAAGEICVDDRRGVGIRPGHGWTNRLCGRIG